MTSLVGFAFAAATALSWVLTGAVRRYALARAVLDVPNERSSHTQPTPRGGGLAIVAVIAIGILIGAAAGAIRLSLAIGLLGGVGIISGVGWIDDRTGVPARVRAACHLAAAVWATSWVGGVSDLHVGHSIYHVGWIGTVVGWVAIVWLVNLYNFMDGIDGIAGFEAVVVSGGAAALLLLTNGDASLLMVLAVVGGAAAGFLPWNWSPAKIFMGDVGSGSLGYVFGVLALASEKSGALPAIVWVILLAAFVVDATLTLARRVLRGERWYQAHRSHAYQRAVQSGLSHACVTSAVTGANLMLVALAAIAVVQPGVVLIMLAVAVLLVGGTYAYVERMRPM